jgi:glycosyltransferase involved in cell wall biosynthesis
VVAFDRKIDSSGFMGYTLGVLAPSIGALSETFIGRHMRELLPGGTVTVAETVDRQWTVDGPVLILQRRCDVGSWQQPIARLARRLGYPSQDRFALVRKFLQGHKLKVILSEYLDWSLPWLEVAQDLKLRFFVHAHGYDISEKLRDPKIRSKYLRYNQACGVVTMSQASRDKLLGLGLDRDKVHVIPYGVNVPAQPPKRNDRKTIRCLAVGRMAPKKAPLLTLEAFRRASETCPNLRLDYVGSGALYPAAQQFVRAFNLDDQVSLHGERPNQFVQLLMRGADIFLQHSMTDPVTGDEEGMPVAILEAMANGLPVVSTRHAGIPEAVEDGASGYLGAEGDSVGMAERLCILAQDSDARRRMGEAGWVRAKEHFSWHQERTSLLRLLGLLQ